MFCTQYIKTCDPDKLYANQQEFDPNKITSEAIDNIMAYRRN